MSHRRGGLQGERTRALIRRALIELVEEKGFAEVTVARIAERAMVNRATFYRYYRDKYALVEEIFQDVIAELSVEVGPAGRVSAGERIAGWERLFEHVGGHHRLYAALLGRRGDPWFAARLRERCVELARDRLRTVHDDDAGRDAASDDLQLVLAADLVLGAITWWLEHRRPRSPREMAEAVVRFTTQGYFGALGIGTAPTG